MALIEKTISNHPGTGLQREIEIAGFLVNDDTKEVSFYYRIKHFFNEAPIPVSVPSKDWKVDNSYKATVRDANFQPVPNPDYVPEYEVIGYTERPVDWNDEEYGVFEPQPMYGDAVINADEVNMQMPAYDYFKSLTFDNPNPVSIPLLLDWYIQDNDAKGFFDFY